MKYNKNRCLLVSLLQSMQLEEMGGGGGGDLTVSCYFLSYLFFTTSPVTLSPGGPFFTFEEHRVGPSGGRFRELFVCGCHRLSVRPERQRREGGRWKTEERKD